MYNHFSNTSRISTRILADQTKWKNEHYDCRVMRPMSHRWWSGFKLGAIPGQNKIKFHLVEPAQCTAKCHRHKTTIWVQKHGLIHK